MQRLNLTPCQCPEPGFCHRHTMSKSRFLWLACQRNLALFQSWEENAQSDPATPLPPQPLPRCQHRSLEVLEHVRCELCGNRSEMVPVHSCAVHGRCTERRFGNSTELSRSTAACTACPGYLPVENVCESGT